ncbi:hypothetical protein C8Q77DRAFT_910607 [Trametes polyzona]|nr:hypothetical protein C8Q77DRAFT_910607 [Trametes polyzona]
MSTFSRVIARPVPANQANPLPRSLGAPSVQEHQGDGRPERMQRSINGPFLLFTKVYEDSMHKNVEGKTSPDNGHASGDHRQWEGSDPVFPAKPFPRLFTLRRGASFAPVPSLWSNGSNDSATESILSASPPLSSPQSPPPTGWSMIAVLGSPGYMEGFGVEYDRPEAHPDFMRMELQWNRGLRRIARMRDGDFRDTDDDEDYTVADEPILPVRHIAHPPVRKPPTDQPASTSEENATGRTSRLGQRVQTPPPLNTSVIRVRTLLAKLLRGAYDVEVGNVDGSDISDNESNCDADDEEGYGSSSNDDAGEPDHGDPEPGQEQATAALGTRSDDEWQPQTAKKTYAAVAASSSKGGVVAPPGDHVQQTSAVPLIRVSEVKDWTRVCDRRGPLVEVTDV